MNTDSGVFIISREYPPITVGGTSTVARNLAVGLVAEGWRVHVVTTHAGAEDVREHVDGVSVLRTGAGLVYNAGTGLADQSLRTHRRIHAAAESLAAEVGTPALVIIPDLFCYPEASMFARRHAIPLINVLLQDFRAITPYDRDSHHVTNGVAAERRHLLSIEEKALRGSDHTTFISYALRDAIAGCYPDSGAPQSVVRLGVDPVEITAVEADPGRLARLAELRAAVGESMRLVVACGRLVPVKGFDVLLEALHRLDPVHLVLVGVGPEDAALRRQVAELGLAGRVTFLGDIPRHEALGWMSVADVAVVPSLWESFCYVCAEMMAFGRAVVASHVDSLRELLPDDTFGYPVPVSGPSGDRHLDPACLAQRLHEALEHPEEAARRGARARARIMEHFTNARFGHEMSELGRRLTGSTVGR